MMKTTTTIARRLTPGDRVEMNGLVREVGITDYNGSTGFVSIEWTDGTYSRIAGGFEVVVER